MSEPVSDFVLRVLRAVASTDCYENIWWRTDPEYAPITFFMKCGDVFWWGAADLEPITPQNMDELERAYTDLQAIPGDHRGHCWAGMLFCARVRKMRPQGVVYSSIPRAVWHLFDACGPGRDPAEFGSTPRPE